MSATLNIENSAGRDPGVVCSVDKNDIRDLQKHLGLDPCFRTAKLLTCETDCEWRHHCRRPVAEWQREW